MSEIFCGVKDFNVANIVSNFQLKPLKMGANVMPIQYRYPTGEVTDLRILTPPVCLPFGLSSDINMGGTGQKWSANISFWHMEEDPLLRSLYDFCMTIDNYLLDVAERETENWFKAKKSRDVLMDRLSPLVKEPKDPQYACTMRIQANPNQYGKFGFLTFQPDGTQLDLVPTIQSAELHVPRMSRVQMLFTIRNAWLTEKGFGWSARCAQLVVFPRRQGITTAVITNYSYDPDTGELIQNKPNSADNEEYDVEMETN